MKRVLVSGISAAALLSSCQGPPDRASAPELSSPGAPVLATADAAVREPMPGFSWLVDARVAGMPQPGARRPLDEDLEFLESEGIDLLVSLTEQPVDPDALVAHGITGLHLPVRDYTAPTLVQLDTYVKAVDRWNAAGKQVGTHCGAGKGRTGTFLAALLVARGRSADAAIAEVRRLRPGSIETAAQAAAVRDYERFLTEHP